MKKIILSMGLGLFLLAFSMHLKTSLDSPMGLVSEKALAYYTGGGSSGCTADDPGECVAACDDGTPCCVGNDPNCSEGINSISCGNGTTWC